jgi:tRNA modification GTPase
MEQTMTNILADINRDTIVAVATPAGVGGIAVIRLSGPKALEIADKVWRGKQLSSEVSHTAHLGEIIAEDGTSTLDQAVATLFRDGRSFTGEDTVEFSVHGSRWIQREVVKRLVDAGARPAGPGEFSQRAFMNGRLDLAQAEGIADVISASSRAAHRLAMSQLKGEFSSRLNQLREQLVDFASLLELELDFSEEDVTFADREKLSNLADEILALLRRLIASYAAGRAFKEGVPVVIAGAPNAGKSTLLNNLLDDDRAIVSDVPGTTRDVIEDTREIGDILFRFIDTAGLRETGDTVESIGIQRAMDRIRKAAIILWMVDLSADTDTQLQCILSQIDELPDVQHFLICNKADIATEKGNISHINDLKCFTISAKTGEGISALESAMVEAAKRDYNPDAELIVTNERHHAALKAGAESLQRAREALDTGISADFIAQDVREALHHLGTVTGAVTTDTLLSSIFSRFCIGK